MTPSRIAAAIVVLVLAVAAVLWWQRRERREPDRTAKKATAAHVSEAEQAVLGRPPGTLPSLPVAGPVGAPQPQASAAGPVPSVAIEPPLTPTPTDEPAQRAALADAHLPIAFSYARFLVDRYLHTPHDLADGVQIDVLFPPEILSRFQLLPRTRLLAVNGRPAELQGVLDEAFRPQPGATWKLKLDLATPEGRPLQHELVLKH
jgi:hypothetical protein